MSKDDLKYKLYQISPYCGICKAPLKIKDVYTPQVNIDHKKPRYHGGGENIDNLQLAHKPCNKRKGSYE